MIHRIDALDSFLGMDGFYSLFLFKIPKDYLSEVGTGYQMPAVFQVDHILYV